MEHLLIRGGEMYLPFARSRVKALRALGMQNAKQQYEVGGASIKVWLYPGHEYIHIYGSDSLKMDSGVVDVRSVIDDYHPSNYLPRALHEVGHARAYNSAFSKVSEAGWRTNPSKGLDGQFSGDLELSEKSCVGSVPENEAIAASFAPKIIESESEPGAFVYSDNDESVPTKKRMATQCPASVFTGKCRLYVQALYGAHAYSGKADGRGKPIGTGREVPPIASLAAPSGTPSLKLRPYIDADDKKADVQWGPVHLHTGCGVFLDTATGRHWLIQTSTTAVTVYPLIGSKAAENARKLLSSGNLSADDAEHLEAYILSTCRPYTKKSETLSIPETPSYSMGYGWHWNWSGTTADIAHNEQEYIGFEGGFHRYGMVSTHYRLSMTPKRDDEGAITSWAVSRSVVSGPSHWAAQPIIWSIYEPTWSALSWGMESTLPYYSLYRPGSATYYVFYLRDELQLCRVVISELSGSARRELSDPTFASGKSPGMAIDELTVGMEEGWCHDFAVSPKYYEAVFSCGSVSSAPLTTSRTEESYRVTNQGKTPGPIVPVATEYTGYYSGEFELAFGYPTPKDPNASPVWPVTQSLGSFSPGPGGADVQRYTSPTLTYQRVLTTKKSQKTSLASVLIPMYDSEAVFFHWQANESTTSFSEETRIHASDGYTSTTGVRYKNGTDSFDGTWSVGAYYTKYRWSSGFLGDLVSTTTNTSIPAPTERKEIVLIGHGGVVPAVLPDLAHYHWTEIAPPISAWAGARLADPVAFSPGKIDPIGTDVDDSMAAVVGWV